MLGGISQGRIRNFMAGRDRVFEVHKGKISAVSAFGWLQDRPAFWNSIWREETKAAAMLPRSR